MHFTYCTEYTLFFSKNQAKTLKSTIFFTPIFIPFLSIPKTYFTPQKQTFKPSSLTHSRHHTYKQTFKPSSTSALRSSLTQRHLSTVILSSHYRPNWSSSGRDVNFFWSSSGARQCEPGIHKPVRQHSLSSIQQSQDCTSFKPSSLHSVQPNGQGLAAKKTFDKRFLRELQLLLASDLS